ncbi:MAG: hypothetical protein FGM58_03235 [Acidimicrobiia bacterium]|nr:hypothetical protein [Acidimicrobiia bacterium]
MLALIAGFSAIAGFMSFWATDEILSSSTWESTGRALVENPAAQRDIAGAVAGQIIEAVGLERFVAGVLPGPLSGLSGTISNKATELLTDATVQVVRTEFFQGVWEQAVAAVHDRFVRAVDGSGGVTSITAKGIELDLGGIVGAVQEQLDRRGITVLDSIDASRIDVSYLLIDAPGLQNVRSWVRTLRILVIVLPAVAVIGAIAAFVIGRRRSFVAAALGAGGLVGAAVVGLVLRAGKAQAVEDLSGGVISPVTADAVVSHISSGVRGALLVSAAVALVVLVLGIVVAIVTSPARSTRT